MQKRNIVLVGFMGTGKTSVGQAVAARLDMSFLDMDDIIEERQARPITRIFAEDGEPFFRRLERELVVELADRQGLVIGAGGGIVLDRNNIAQFEKSGLVVCLGATPAAILQRVQHQTHRPLLAGDDKFAKIEEILRGRQPLYDAVACQVDTNGRTLQQVAEEIVALYEAL